MKYCYKNVCITGQSILAGFLLALVFMIVYSNDRIILIDKDEK